MYKITILCSLFFLVCQTAFATIFIPAPTILVEGIEIPTKRGSYSWVEEFPKVKKLNMIHSHSENTPQLIADVRPTV
ncbi:hypothetical protein [Ammoniphilus sp. 3BR4]|uniref:hypothetical protein n=1 Tax=Ammoniphilus sp. 3BR4 TaxID=3158265 RepID=UPI0034650638